MDELAGEKLNSWREYMVVKFPEENDSLGIIPYNWCFPSEDLCSFPNVRSDSARTALIKNKESPGKDWAVCKIKILHHYSKYLYMHDGPVLFIIFFSLYLLLIYICRQISVRKKKFKEGRGDFRTEHRIGQRQ